ncbi:membrane protein [Tianweitania populi]|uniref:Membrane protein n=2 Tax=Tianweitania populi TaxID=1607949 RepID=A0A8J3GLS1_9HYPH|nr:membrane protein [Tianweitania populi]
MLGSRGKRLTALFMGLFLALSMVAVDHAEARRGGSFGSRGGRTFQSAPATNTAPRQTAPVERSMTPSTAQPGAATRQAQTAGQQRGGLFGGLGGGLMRGLLIGGLFGMLMGHGFGGMAGMFGMLLQILLIGGLIMLAMRFFRSRSQPSPAYAGPGRAAAGAAPNPNWQARRDAEAQPQNNRSFPIPSIGGGAGKPAAVESRDIELAQTDLDTFEQRLAEVQAAFSREDHAALRRLVTPEMVSYLSEELAENAQNGVRNEVTDVTLLQADIAESWSEGTQDYATAALRYESRDRLLDRNSGRLLDGDEELSEITELWTFVRARGGDWKLSAIQEA